MRRDADVEVSAKTLESAIKQTFEVTPIIEVLETGTLAREFEGAIKAPRFKDSR